VSRLTKLVVEAIPIPSKGATYRWDDRLPGFGVKVLPSGARKYLLKYRTPGGRLGKQRWLSLGVHGAITVDQARKLAQRASGDVAGGSDPQDSRNSFASPVPCLQDVWGRFESDHLSMNKASTQRDYLAIWKRLIEPALGRRHVSDIKLHDLDKLHKSLRDTPYQANRMLALLSRLFNLAERWGWNTQGSNPCKQVEKFTERARQRFLSAREISAVQMALRDLQLAGLITQSAANALRMLLLTGARSSEITGAKWDWVNWEQKVLQLPDSKTGPKQIYLGEASLTTLKLQSKVTHGTFIFAGRDADKPIVNLRKPWLRVCEKAGIGKVRIHDLRHTAASVAVAAGASLAVVGKLLGHTQAQTTLRYAHLDTDVALKAANLVSETISRFDK
jgi:integrase